MTITSKFELLKVGLEKENSDYIWAEYIYRMSKRNKQDND